LRLKRVEFTWNVPFLDDSGKWDYRTVFEAPRFALFWLEVQSLIQQFLNFVGFGFH
jgi:hypothetical protein